MTALPDLSALDPALVAQAQAEIVDRVQAENPALDLRRGVFADLLAYYNAVLATRVQAGIAACLKARSLLALNADPSADPALVDDVLSNWGLSRGPGARAGGEVTVVVSDDVTVTVARGSAWQAAGRTFLATAVFTAKVEPAQVDSASDRLLTPTADGNWAFTIDVEAAADGAGAAVPKDALVVPAVVPPRYVTSFASDDFSAGLDPEGNADLLARLRQGVAARAMSNRVNMAAALRAQEAFSRVPASSIVGFGDPEMSRDRHGIFPVSGGGRVDWYVRTQEAARRVRLVKTAALAVKNADGTGVWNVAVGRDDAPGFYELGPVRPADAGGAVGGYEVLSDDRSADLSGPGFVPDVRADSSEWAFTRFQTASVSFVDADTDVSALEPGARRQYELEAVCLPLIAEIQDYVSSRDVRPLAADCLVKAPVPCFVRLQLTVFRAAGEAPADADALRAALCHAVNTVGFTGALYASRLQAVVQPLLPAGQSVSAIDMLGRIRYPDGRLRYLRGSELLRVPDEPADMVSPRTVQFFAGPDDVIVSSAATVPSGP